MEEQDIRWEQRFSNYKKALTKLGEAVQLNSVRALSELEKQGIIQAFKYTHELAWKVMQDFFIDQGNTEIRGSKDATRLAFSVELISDGDHWMEMIKKGILPATPTTRKYQKRFIGISWMYFILFL